MRWRARTYRALIGIVAAAIAALALTVAALESAHLGPPASPGEGGPVVRAGVPDSFTDLSGTRFVCVASRIGTMDEPIWQPLPTPPPPGAVPISAPYPPY